MLKRKLICLLSLVASTAVAKETARSLPNIEASLVVEKQQYFVGEPIMLTFIAHYNGATPTSLVDSDPYGQCSPYQIAVNPESSRREPESGPPCAPFFSLINASCLTGGLNFVPGSEVKQRILLNRLHDFTHPGTYVVKATRHMSYFENWGQRDQPTGQALATFTFTIVVPHSPDDIKDSFSPYLEDLLTDSYQRQREAAVVIGSLSAPFLEPYLLWMLSTPNLEDQAITGLRRLNTEKGREAIFGLLKRDDSFGPYQQLAVEALQDMGDAGYAPRLLTLRNKSGNIDKKTELLTAAARLDPKSTLSVIRPLLESSNEHDREDGVKALEATEQPEALPLLVPALSDSSLQVRSIAARALVFLTRQTPSKDGLSWSGEDPITDAPFWWAWLQANPQLPIHLMRECPEMARW